MKFKYKQIYYVYVIAFIISFNLFFRIFVWHDYDKSPNQALAVHSLVVIIWTIILWRKESKFAKSQEKEQ